MIHNPRLFPVLACIPLSLCLYGFPSPVDAQDSGDQGTMVRGDRGEIAVTVRDASGGGLITSPASVKLYKNGMPSDQSQT